MFCIFRFIMYTRSTEWMRRLICAFVVRIFSKQFFTFRGPTFIASHTFSQPRHDKTCLRGFRPGSTQTGLYSHRRWLVALNFGFRKQRDRTICVTKTKALISCTLVFAYAKSIFLTTRLIFYSCSNSLRYSHNTVSFIL